jgi:hypothetical protein
METRNWGRFPCSVFTVMAGFVQDTPRHDTTQHCPMIRPNTSNRQTSNFTPWASGSLAE